MQWMKNWLQAQCAWILTRYWFGDAVIVWVESPQRVGRQLCERIKAVVSKTVLVTYASSFLCCNYTLFLLITPTSIVLTVKCNSMTLT